MASVSDGFYSVAALVAGSEGTMKKKLSLRVVTKNGKRPILKTNPSSLNTRY